MVFARVGCNHDRRTTNSEHGTAGRSDIVMEVRWEEGFRRITLLFSGLLLVVGLFWSGLYGINEKPGWAMYLGGVGIAILIAMIPWVIFVVVRWIVRGFASRAA